MVGVGVGNTVISISQAIASLDEGIPPELFDIEQVRQHMRNIYKV